MAFTAKHTFFGSGSCLDWRLTSFVNAFPPDRLCSFCNLVVPTLATLPCEHTVCKTCYDLRPRDRCLLDKQPFREVHVTWKTFCRDDVLRLEVRCWNAPHGCDFMGAVLAMLEHFASACAYHAVNCRACARKVVHGDLWRHLESGCASHRYAELEPLGDNLANTCPENSAERTIVALSGQRPFSETDRATPPATIADEAETAPRHANAASLPAESRTALPVDDRGEIEDIATGRSQSAGLFLERESKWSLEDAFEVVEVAAGAAQAAVLTAPGSNIDAFGAVGRTAVVPENAPTRWRTSSTQKEVGVGLRHAAGVGATAGDPISVSEPYEWCIDDVPSFIAFRLNSDRPRRLFSATRYYYGYRIVAEVVISPTHPYKIRLKAYAFGGAFDELLTWPVNRTPTLQFVHPSDCSRDFVMSETTPWGKDFTNGTPRGALYTWAGAMFTSIADLNERGCIANSKLRFRFDLV
ncbi:uncharacterized protein [Dermacentor albipictus]|uniref:uncharacterized protein n=1 Tax=Dermacentor albipictus TaxID=60249 RepID=UPI0031FBC26B